jgi:hypothetical protein
MSHTLVRYNGTDETTLSISGTMSADGLTIETATADYRQVLLQRFGDKTETRTTTRHAVIHGFHGIEMPGQLPYFWQTGGEIGALVSGMTATDKYVDVDGIVKLDYRLTSTDFVSGTAVLAIAFAER